MTFVQTGGVYVRRSCVLRAFANALEILRGNRLGASTHRPVHCGK